jgi:hypothetical protein
LIPLAARIVRGSSSPHRPMRRVFAVLIAVLVCMLAAAATALASGRSVIRDCTDNGRIDSYHSQSDYKDALRRLPSDVDEYTDCRQIIESAKRRDAGKAPPGSGGSGGGGGGGSAGGGGGVGAIAGGFDTPTPPPASNVPVSPSEANVLGQVPGTGGQAVQVAGEPITPGGKGLTEAAFSHSLPTPLLVIVILLGLGALAMTVSAARARGIHAPGGVVRVFDRVFPRRA